MKHFTKLRVNRFPIKQISILTFYIVRKTVARCSSACTVKFFGERETIVRVVGEHTVLDGVDLNVYTSMIHPRVNSSSNATSDYRSTVYLLQWIRGTDVESVYCSILAEISALSRVVKKNHTSYNLNTPGGLEISTHATILRKENKLGNNTMTTAIEVLWKQALKTFGGRRNTGFKLCQKNFDKLWALMNKTTAEHVRLDQHVLDLVQVQLAPMCVIDIFENKDVIIAIFILKHGITMPMHDHPGMHGFLKVISGVVEINSYTLKTNSEHIPKSNEEIKAVRHRPITVDSNSPACVLTPSDRNLHEISCIEGPAAFLDILSPPYDVDDSGKGLRPCTFYKITRSKMCSESDVVEDVQLTVMENPPNFYSQSLKYTGPPLV